MIGVGRKHGLRSAAEAWLGERQEIVARLSESGAAAEPDSESRATARLGYS